MASRTASTVLGALLAATLLAAVTMKREEWPGLVGDEATYLMQAQSLAWDFDLTYSRADFERFVELWKRPPNGLILQSGDGGETITFGKPSFYPLAIAPFVRFAPRRGHAIGNALFLGLAALISAAALRRAIGPWAPLWVAAFLFASVAFASVFWAHADLFLMSLTAIGLALAFGGKDRERSAERGPGRLRWVVTGALLAAVGMARPLYLTLLLPALLVARRTGRWRNVATLAGGFGLVVLATLGASYALHGTWSSYEGQRMGFYSYTGFPEVNLEGTWSEELSSRGGTGSWVAPLPNPVYPRLTAWNVVYLFAGRNVGLLPYFFPLVLGFVAFRSDLPRWGLLVAVAATVAAFLYLRPFNFYGGGGSIANRYFLPVYPAFWFLAARPSRGFWAPLAVALVAAPFMWPLWTAPRAYPMDPAGGFRYVSAVAERLLPYETSLDHLKPSGRDDVIHRGLWLKLLSNTLDTEAEGQQIVLHRGQRRGELLLGSPAPLTGLELVVDGRGDPLDIRGATVLERIPGPRRLRYRLALDRPTARHRMWWTLEDVWLYRIRLNRMTAEAPELRFTIEALPGVLGS